MRAAGLRVTRARLALMSALEEAPGPCPASLLADRLAHSCDRPTVYRNLTALVEAGLVRELGKVSGQTWYQHARHQRPGALFVCDDCGSAYPVNARVEATEPRWQAAFSCAFPLLAGICPGCASDTPEPLP